jgi:hypothetical protein
VHVCLLVLVLRVKVTEAPVDDFSPLSPAINFKFINDLIFMIFSVGFLF